jgi:hypothetical protein
VLVDTADVADTADAATSFTEVDVFFWWDNTINSRFYNYRCNGICPGAFK